MEGQQLRANRDNVWKAAQALADQGKTPSVNTVRDWLGGGSNSSISRYLQQWHASSAAERSIRLALPLHLQDALDDMLSEIKNAAAQQYQAQLENYQTLQTDTAQQQSRLLQFAERQAGLEQQLTQLQTELAESRQQQALAEQAAAHWQQQAQASTATPDGALAAQLTHQQQLLESISTDLQFVTEQLRRRQQLKAELEQLRDSLGGA